MAQPNIIETVRNWMVRAGQISVTPEINARRAAFQVGMQLEELAEKLSAIHVGMERVDALRPFVSQMVKLASDFKRGDYDGSVLATLLDPSDSAEFLDADIDILWVTAGSLPSQGADGLGAFAAVDVKNWAKYPNGVVTLDAHGKVVKPEGWTPPDLRPFTFLGRQQAVQNDPQLQLVP